MVDYVVIDKDLIGWAGKHEDELSKIYAKVVKVGIDVDLPQRKRDDEIASYCKDNNCDLLTADTEAYMNFFDIGVKALEIARYDHDEKADKHIYLIKITKV